MMVIILVVIIPWNRRKPRLSFIPSPWSCYQQPSIPKDSSFVSEPHGWENRREAPHKGYTLFEVMGSLMIIPNKNISQRNHTHTAKARGNFPVEQQSHLKKTNYKSHLPLNHDDGRKNRISSNNNKKRPKTKLPNKNVLHRSPARIFGRPCCVTNIFLDQRNGIRQLGQQELELDPIDMLSSILYA